MENSKKYSLEKFPSEKILKNHELQKIIKHIGQYKVAVYNGGCPSISSLGSYIYNNVNCDFVWIWTLNLSKKEIIVSLRSNTDGINVGEIANCFGGGGHIGAAAFSFNINKYSIQDFFQKK